MVNNVVKWVEFKMHPSPTSNKAAKHGAPIQVLDYLRQKYGYREVYPYEHIGAIMNKLKINFRR